MDRALDAEVPVTREGAVGALKIVMIVLAAAIFWQSALAVNAELHARGLVTAPPFKEGAARLLVGTETTAAFQERLSEFLTANHRLCALVLMMISAIALVVRYVALGRIFDFLYLESEARERRIYTGFLVNIMLILAHAGAMYGLVILGSGEHASEVPLALLVLLGLNLFWFVRILLSARRVERHALRGLWYLAGTTLTAAVVLFCATWVIDGVPAGEASIRGSKLVALSAGVALALCLADAYLQSHIYVASSAVSRPRGEVAEI